MTFINKALNVFFCIFERRKSRAVPRRSMAPKKAKDIASSSSGTRRLKALEDDDEFTKYNTDHNMPQYQIETKKKITEIVEVEEDEPICRCSPYLLMSTLSKLNAKQKQAVHDLYSTSYTI